MAEFVVALGLGGGVAVALLAWRARASRWRAPRRPHIDPFTLKEPWRRSVQDAVQAGNRFRSVVEGARPGPLRERLGDIGRRVDAGVGEAWRAAKQGQDLVLARRHIDAPRATRELEAAGADARPELIAALQAQIDSAARLDTAIADAQSRLRLTTARLDEAVARAVEVSVGTHGLEQLEGLDQDVEAAVTELEALRQGLEAVDRPALGP
jgi:hypothetical protein